MLMRCLKKMYKNKFIYLALTLGLILSIITIIVIPMFARSSQDKLIRQALDQYGKEKKLHPLSIAYKYKNSQDEAKITDEFINKSDQVSKINIEKYKLPMIDSRRMLSTSEFLFWDPNADILKKVNLINKFELISINNMDKYIKILKGKLPEKSHDIQEVIIHKNVFNESSLELDKVYVTTLDKDASYVLSSLNDKGHKTSKFKIVGIYDLKESTFWTKGIVQVKNEFLLTDMNIHKEILNIKPNNYEYINEYYMDYSKLKYSQLNRKFGHNLLDVFKESNDNLKKNDGYVSWFLSDIVKTVESQMKSTTNMMVIILNPLVFMLILYVLMLSKIIAINDSNEISLLKSRGAELYQIFMPYIVKGMIMGTIGIIIGPFIAKYIVKFMGCTTEFLTFDSTSDLISYITPWDYLVSLVVIVLFIVAMLIPVYITSKKTIVDLKRDKVRLAPVALWKKYGIDIVILGVSLYCFYNFVGRYYSNGELSMEKDPLIYLVITGMSLGITLLFLRIYPIIIKGIFKAGKNFWKPETYYTLLYSIRNSSKKEYIMVFLIFTFSIGIFNMNSARKINREGEHNIEYANGADIVVKELFDDNETAFDKNYKKYKAIDGVEETSKIMYKDEIMLINESKTQKCRFTAINPYEFGNTAWMRDDLFSKPWNKYLNALTLDPSAILISSSLAKDGYKVGDVLEMRVPYGPKFVNDPFVPQYSMKCRIVGTFNYWPGWSSKEKGYERLVVGNFQHTIENSRSIKYDVWLRTKTGVKSEEIRENLIKNNIIPEVFEAVDKKVYTFHKNMFVQTVNATYTFAFIMTMIVAVVGFIVYWSLSIKERELQFGIIRALGLSKKKVYKMILLEQIIFTFVALVIGVTIGTKIFDFIAPITNESNIQGRIDLPILVKYLPSDYIKIFFVVGIMAIVVLAILITYISKLKVNQAIKLGED